MKKINNGFSLAEVLISVGIISVIATLGFNITKKNIDRAYDGYIYNGVNSLQLALEDAEARKISLLNDKITHIAGLMKDTDENNNTISAPNGIQYTFANMGNYKDNNDEKEVYIITMSVPRRNTNNNNGRITYEFLYLPATQFKLLIPYSADGGNGDLIDRRDLLAYHYVDDDQNNVFGSFRDCVCHTYGTITLNEYTPEQQLVALLRFMKYYAAAQNNTVFEPIEQESDSEANEDNNPNQEQNSLQILNCDGIQRNGLPNTIRLMDPHDLP